MKAEQLKGLVDKAKAGNADVNDVVLIAADMFESFSKHLKDIKEKQDVIIQKLEDNNLQVSEIQSHTSDWVYRAIIEDVDD